MNTKTPFLTDGGLETWLFFQRGFEAPEFAAIALIEDEAARAALNEYLDKALARARRQGHMVAVLFIDLYCLWRRYGFRVRAGYQHVARLPSVGREIGPNQSRIT